MQCTWPANDEQMLHYHDTEWGTPVHDDKKHFEFIVLDSFQAGLSWKTILHRRKHFKKAFANFDVKKVAKFDETMVLELMQNEGIIRNRLKIDSTIKNAQAYLAMQKNGEDFSEFLWSFVGGKPKQNKWKSMSQAPAFTAESDAMCKALKQRGFNFVGSTICYAFMQATGMVNDHIVGCHRYKICEAGK